MEEVYDREGDRWKAGEAKKLPARVGKRDEGLLKEELGTLAQRAKAAEHAVDVVIASQIVNDVTKPSVTTMASNSNSFIILNYRFTFSKSLVDGVA